MFPTLTPAATLTLDSVVEELRSAWPIRPTVMLGWCASNSARKIALGQLGGIAAGLLGKLQQMFKHGQELRALLQFLAFAPTWHADLHAMFDARFLFDAPLGCACDTHRCVFGARQQHARANARAGLELTCLLLSYLQRQPGPSHVNLHRAIRTDLTACRQFQSQAAGDDRKRGRQRCGIEPDHPLLGDPQLIAPFQSFHHVAQAGE